jgi:two-component system sensor histidine kinase/response regulator
MGPSQNGPASFRGLHVLLVDDCQLYRSMTSIVLRNLGLRVTFANDGKEAVDALQKRDFDVVLMAIEMPVMDGLAATIEIRQREALLHKYTPIVAFTCTTDRDRCFAAGMDGFAPKPLMPDDLEQIYRIVTHIRSRQHSRLA